VLDAKDRPLLLDSVEDVSISGGNLELPPERR
jgi:hypothetical protein